ncbi:MAG: hypothetical protein ACRBCS_10785 [Cellvibrionaceae bacterium]
MKDLYRRNNLHSGESRTSKLHSIENAFEEDREAAFSILLNTERKKVYDFSHETLRAIGRLREKNDLNTTEWRKANSDYVILSSEAPIKKNKNKNESVFYQPTDNQSVGSSRNASDSVNRPRDNNDLRHNNSGKFNQESVNPLLESGSDDEGILKKVSSKMSDLFQRFTWVFGVCLFVVMLWLMFSEDNAGSKTEFIEKETKHAVNPVVTAYSKPSISETVVATIERYDDVTVVPSKSISNWDFVEVGENGAYILKSELGEGRGEVQFVETCRASGTTRPESGEVSLYRPTGIHKLIISNPPGKDTLLKMKSSRGKASLVAYVRGGENFTVDNIAEGDYYFEFSIGDNYSPACQRFLDDAYAIRDEEPKYFTATKKGLELLPRTISYVLKNEIFNTKRIPMRHF